MDQEAPILVLHSNSNRTNIPDLSSQRSYSKDTCKKIKQQAKVNDKTSEKVCVMVACLKEPDFLRDNPSLPKTHVLKSHRRDDLMLLQQQHTAETEEL